jgi:hypothetical protein
VDEMMTKEKNGYEVVSKELNYYATVTSRF